MGFKAACKIQFINCRPFCIMVLAIASYICGIWLRIHAL